MTDIKQSDNPEEIRRALDEDERQEFLNRKTGKWYVVQGGEIKQIGGDDEQQAA